MASTSSDIEALKAENARLRAENTDLFHQMESWRRDAHELDEMVSNLRERIRRLLGHIPAGALPAPTVFGDPRSVPGGDGAAAAAGGGHPSPPVARSVSSHGPPLSLGPSPAGALPALGPAPAIGNWTGVEEGWIVDTIPGLHRTYANLSDTGCWTYWEQLPDGRYKWAPKWVEDNE